ncbi:MAG TPA: NmrA family NAD(P)-binding protein [Actinokineospora sp.]|jgi:uncharacterized protein YbjT (DUF2867 family)|nr:NmrA family NAD(P)-binding protein [Actinokineospora sp.]
MAHVLVTGATGKQGGALAALLLRHGHEVSAYVRDLQSPSAQALARTGARLVQGDLADAVALGRAAAGKDAIFGLSVPFGRGGKEEEIGQGRVLVDTAVTRDAFLVYSSVRGGDRLNASQVEHADSKQVVEAYLREKSPRATVLGPVYFMENALNVGFNRLSENIFSLPLSPDKNLDQVTVLDIAGMAVHAIENPSEMAGQRVDIASDSISGAEIARILGRILGREIPYEVFPIDMVRQWAGDEIGTMFEAFEKNTSYVDLTTLHSRYPTVKWHSFEEWANQVDWGRVLSSR